MSKKVSSSNRRIGLLIVLGIAIYIIIQFFKLISRQDISAYQVKEGSLAVSSVYTGLALREETIYQSNKTGFIDYFAREGEHVAVGDLVYLIDESGAIDQLLNNGELGENSLSNQDLENLKREIVNFNSGFDARNFSSVYDFLYDIDGAVLKLANRNILEELSRTNSTVNLDLVNLNHASEAGYVVYNVDGYESLSVNGITPEVFEQENYEKVQLLNNSMIDAGNDAYKLITSEEWMLVIPLEEERALELMGESYVEIKFLSNQQTVWASIKVQQLGDQFYGYLTLNNSVATFCTERFIDIELITNNESGLKIPISSIVYSDFLVIPKEYEIEKIDDNTSQFLKKTFGADGTISSELITVDIYAEKEDGYYVDESQLRVGDYLLREDTAEEIAVQIRGQLVGVYCINQGYAEFRQIVILYQNDEYAIVKSNTDHGLNVYDYIVLDASVVSENDLIFE